MGYNSDTFRLFKKTPSFIDGVSSLMDLSDNKDRYNINSTEKEADFKSIQADWLAIGNDMQKAIDD